MPGGCAAGVRPAPLNFIFMPQSTAVSESSNQLEFLAGADPAVLDEQERSGVFTGERLRRIRPQVYQAIIEGYAGGASMRRLGQLYKVSTNTISAVVQSENSSIEALKKRIGRKATAVYALAFERLEEDLSNDDVMVKTSPKDKAVIVGILGDRSQIESGQPTQIIEHRVIDAGDINDEFLDAIDVTPRGPAMGFAGELAPTKGLPDRGGLGAGEPVELAGDAARRDVKSLDDLPQGQQMRGLEESDA